MSIDIVTAVHPFGISVNNTEPFPPGTICRFWSGLQSEGGEYLGESPVTRYDKTDPFVLWIKTPPSVLPGCIVIA